MSVNWRHPFWRWVGIGMAVTAAIVAVIFLIGRIFPGSRPGPTESERRSDSLAITKPIDQALIDSSNARIAGRQGASRAAEEAARTALERAARNRRLADSLAVIARLAVDSAAAWHRAYDARELEAVDLRSTVASNATVIFNLKADTTELRGQLGIVNRRLKTTEDVNAGLRKDLDQARNCKILGLVNCPSRFQVAALTAVTYFAADRFAQSRK